jgi:hypothetical protein
VRSKALPIAIAAHAAVLALMLLTKPGPAEPTPDPTDAGVADVALLLVILGTAVIHAVHLHRWRARLTRSLVPASSMASHATATKLIPSPRYETAKPRISRRNTRFASTGQ